MKNFVLIGAAGYIAPRHMKAIKETGNNLIAAYDPYDGVGIMDSYFPQAHFFTEFERFDRHLEKLKRTETPIDHVSICSPNYLHDAHIRYGLRIGADVICEKPVVLNPWNVDALLELESDYANKVYTVLQLRHHQAILALKEKIDHGHKDKTYDIDLTYITSRGKWYYTSWKGDEDKSGGVVSNIGVHFFDMLIWIFGPVKSFEIFKKNQSTVKGTLKLEKANVNWFLSIDSIYLPNKQKKDKQSSHRSLIIDGEEINFNQGFTDLHTICYKEILENKGFGLKDSLSAIELISNIRKR